jgi:hypothetical protein
MCTHVHLRMTRQLGQFQECFGGCLGAQPLRDGWSSPAPLAPATTCVSVSSCLPAVCQPYRTSNFIIGVQRDCMHGRMVPWSNGLGNPRLSSGAYKYKASKYHICCGRLERWYCRRQSPPIFRWLPHNSTCPPLRNSVYKADDARSIVNLIEIDFAMFHINIFVLKQQR